MRLVLLICAVCLLALAFGCKRSGQQSTDNSAGTAPVSNSLEADRGRARALLEQGKALYRDDKDEEAVAADPELAEARFRLGLGYEALGKREEAETEFKKAVTNYKKYLTEHADDA